MDIFECKLTDQSTGSFSALSVAKESISQTMFQAEFVDIQPKHEYVFSVFAENEKGMSETASTDVDCHASGKL